MIPDNTPLKILRLTEPIEFGFYYLIPVFIILDLIILIWLIYWFFEFVNKEQYQQLNKLLTVIFWFEFLATLFSTIGYLLMFVDIRSVNPLLGFILNCMAVTLLAGSIPMFIVFLIKKKSIDSNTKTN